MSKCKQCSVEKLNQKYSDAIKFECIAGSHAYGTSLPTSDVDTRGIFILPSTEYVGLKRPYEQASDNKNDIVYYSLKRFFELINTANPNLIELLFMPKDYISINDPILTPLFDNRDMFITKKAYWSHANYAFDQIKKAKGQNKRVHNPWPKKRPSREDYCYVINADAYLSIVNGYYRSLNDISIKTQWPKDHFPFRPLPLKKTNFDLRDFHVASMEHMENTYRLYYYGKNAKGVFRGDNEMLVCESIPKEDEWQRFRGLLIYNEDTYNKAVKEWGQYWDWMENRNKSRWVDQESGKLTYDQKNMMHNIRLLWSAENIALNGEPIVRFSGEKLDTLMKIRNGEFTYEEILEMSEEASKNMKNAFDKSGLPDNVNADKVDELYQFIQSQV